MEGEGGEEKKKMFWEEKKKMFFWVIFFLGAISHGRYTFQGPMIRYTVKEKHISYAVSEILWYKQIYSVTFI